MSSIAAPLQPHHARQPARPRLSRHYIDGVRREQLLAAATELVATQGYEASTVAELVKHGRCARNTFYDLFRSREDCIRQAISRAGERLLARVIGAGAGVEGMADAFTAFLSEESTAAHLYLIEAPVVAVDLFWESQDRIAEQAPPVSATGGRFALGALSTAARFLDAGGLADCAAALPAALAEQAAQIEGLRVELGVPTVTAAEEMRATLPPGRHCLDQEFVRANQRARLLEATGAALAERGVRAMRISDVCAAGQLSRRTFYEHFASTREAAGAFLEGAFGGLLEALAHEPWEADVIAATIASHPARALLVEAPIAAPETYRSWMNKVAALAGSARRAAIFAGAAGAVQRELQGAGRG